MTDADVSLRGRVALVTGAGRNIGRRIAVTLAGHGALVAVNARQNRAEAGAVCDEIAALGGRAIPVIGDVSRSPDVARIFDEIHGGLGQVSIVVNNAAVRPLQPFLEISVEDWDWVLGVGLRGPFLCAQAGARDMVEAGWGRIINISGRDGFIGRLNRAHGVTAKAGIHGLTRALAKELGPHGITTNTIVPGATRTTRPAEWYPGYDDGERATTIPVGRVGTPYDIARAVVFLATDPGYVNGAALHVNGGESLL